ncbi:MAG TPA: TSUP family transporter [Myxococcota bacterium]|nr:TSUP family transporter [Myxococcota bacterium]HQK51092.1 TSUP family transporter [Myxococcota bacterium]
MPHWDVMVWLLAASGLAGFVDAVAGGGGLILLPALLLGLPLETPLPTVLGTNKMAAVVGTGGAAWHYGRRGLVTMAEVPGPLIAAGGGSVVGARLTWLLAPGVFRPVLVGVLFGVWWVVVLSPSLGVAARPRMGRGAERVTATLIALGMGFYDGLIGPGTGSLLLLLFVWALGMDFLKGSALAKVANLGSNLGALALFGSRGALLPALGLSLAVTNLVGGLLGARLAVRMGSAWVRRFFLLVVLGLLLRLAWQEFRG